MFLPRWFDKMCYKDLKLVLHVCNIVWVHKITPLCQIETFLLDMLFWNLSSQKIVLGICLFNKYIHKFIVNWKVIRKLYIMNIGKFVLLCYSKDNKNKNIEHRCSKVIVQILLQKCTIPMMLHKKTPNNRNLTCHIKHIFWDGNSTINITSTTDLNNLLS